VRIIQSKLQAKLDEIRSYCQQHEIVSIEANREILKERIGRVEQQLTETQSELQQSEAEIEDLRQKVAEVEKEIVNDRRATTDVTWSGMRQRMYELEIRERELSSKYEGMHPELQEVQQQLREARKILAKLNTEMVERTTTPNPARLRLEQDLRSQLTRVVGLRSKLSELRRQRKDLYAKVHELLQYELHLDKLERDAGTLRASYQIHSGKLEEARVIADLEQNQISNISVAQPATFVERPASPNKRLIAAAAVMLALMASLGAAFYGELTNKALYSKAQVENLLRTPVVACFPLIRQPAEQPSDWDGQVLAELRRHARPIVSELIFRPNSATGGHSGGRLVGVLSCGTGNGGSTVAAALALAASEDCQLSTVLVDSDIRSRYVSRVFHLNGAPGLYEMSSAKVGVAECLQPSRAAGLELISSSGRDPGARSPGLNPVLIASRLGELRPLHDLIVVDLPPADEAQQALSLAAPLDCVLLVVESEKTERHAAEQIRAQLARAGTEVLGVVLNKTRQHVPNWVARLL
jgi:Mrp family chromosome partitioning ATPase